MKIQIFRVLSFIVTFLVALIVISAIMNSGNTDLSVEQSEPILPVVYANVEGYYVNQMHGYFSDQNANSFRENLTPLPGNRKIYIKINTFGTKIKKISYEVRSIDAKRLIEETQIYDYIDNGDNITGDFDIKDLIDKNSEYLLITKLELQDGREARYYTRIVWFEEMNASSMIKFVNDFHKKTFNKEEAKDITTYLESNNEGDNTNYGKVNINSSFNQITWGDLEIKEVADEEITLVEMDETTATIMIDSTVTAKTNLGIEKHRVSEYFRIRSGNERIYLLDYERTMDQYFDPTDISFEGEAISLGITSGDVLVSENTDGSVVMYYINNALYSYNTLNGALSRVFSYYDENDFDIRTTFNKNNIKIINIDENGNSLFLSYGYAARGRHEGMMGISVYYYDITMNTIEERLYIPYNKSYAMLNACLNRIAYVSRKNDLFLYLDEAIYKINLDTYEAEIVVKNLDDESFEVSSTNQIVAWQSDNNQKMIYQMDLNSGNITEISDEKGDYLRLFGFVGEDIVYGTYSECIYVTTDKGTIPVSKKLIIKDKMGNELKCYDQERVYITEATIADQNIRLSRLEITDDNTFMEISDDQITYNLETESKHNTLVIAPTKEFEKVTQISLENGNPGKAINLMTPSEMLFEVNNSVVLDELPIQDSRYYVYYKTQLQGIYKSPEPAINQASELAGTAVKDNAEYIWTRGNRRSKVQLSGITEYGLDDNIEDIRQNTLSSCLKSIIDYEGKSPKDKYIANNVNDVKNIINSNIEADALELNGCDLVTILYYTDKEIPVIAEIGENGYVLIVGYDELNIIVMDPITGTIHKIGLNDSTKEFERNGNRYITYIKKA